MLDLTRREPPLTVKQHIKKINAAIDKYFTQLPRHHYWISVNYFSPGKGYNFYFNEERPNTYQLSRSLEDIENCSFDDLLLIIQGIRKQWDFTIEYRNFTQDEMWVLRKELGPKM